MTKITDARSVAGISGQRILFDTNIWLILDGPYFGAIDFRQDVYSNAYKVLRESNTILTNEYILAEFCNRYVKLEYDAAKRQSRVGDAFPKFKDYRKSDEFKPIMEAARDTCLNFLDECEFVPISSDHGSISAVVGDFCDGKLDFSDLVLRDHCRGEGLFLMTDDADFVGCEIEIITANKRALRFMNRTDAR